MGIEAHTLELFTNTWRKLRACRHPCLVSDRYTALCVMEAWAATKTAVVEGGLYGDRSVPQCSWEDWWILIRLSEEFNCLWSILPLAVCYTGRSCGSCVCCQSSSQMLRQRRMRCRCNCKIHLKGVWLFITIYRILSCTMGAQNGSVHLYSRGVLKEEISQELQSS